MRWLIGAVIGMGVLIVIGLAVLVAGIVYKAGDGDGAGPEAVAPAAAGKLRTGVLSLGLPAAAKVLRMTEVRGGLALLVLMPSGEQVIYAVPLDRRQPPFRIRVTGPERK